MRKTAWLVGALLLGCGEPEKEFVPEAPAACRATLLSDAAPWLLDVEPDPMGGYLAVGFAAPGAGGHFFRLNDDLEIVYDRALPAFPSGGVSLQRWGDHWIVVGAADVLRIDREGEVLAARKFGEHGVTTGVHGVVGRSSGLLVLWSDWSAGTVLEEVDAELQTSRTGSAGDACCQLDLHGGDAAVFITGKLSGWTGPLWRYPVTPQLEAQAQQELFANEEHLAFRVGTEDGSTYVATRSGKDVVLKRFLAGAFAARVVLPDAEGFVTIRPEQDRLLVYENPVDNSFEHPLRVWTVATDLSSVSAPLVYGSGVDVAFVEQREGGESRALVHRHGGGNYDELWRFEGRGCTEADWGE